MRTSKFQKEYFASPAKDNVKMTEMDNEILIIKQKGFFV